MQDANPLYPQRLFHVQTKRLPHGAYIAGDTGTGTPDGRRAPETSARPAASGDTARRTGSTPAPSSMPPVTRRIMKLQNSSSAGPCDQGPSLCTVSPC